MPTKGQRYMTGTTLRETALKMTMYIIQKISH